MPVIKSRTKPICIEGKWYGNNHEASKQLKISIEDIEEMVLSRMAVRGCSEPASNGWTVPPPESMIPSLKEFDGCTDPLCVLACDYPSIERASELLNISEDVIMDMLREGKNAWFLPTPYREAHRRGPSPTPCIYKGHPYSGAKAASRATHVTPQSVKSACESKAANGSRFIQVNECISIHEFDESEPINTEMEVSEEDNSLFEDCEYDQEEAMRMVEGSPPDDEVTKEMDRLLT